MEENTRFETGLAEHSSARSDSPKGEKKDKDEVDSPKEKVDSPQGEKKDKDKVDSPKDKERQSKVGSPKRKTKDKVDSP